MASYESLQKAQIPLCSFCKLEKKTEWKCIDCDKYLCYECKMFHLWNINWSEHKILWTRSSITEGLSDSAELVEICCTKHENYYNTNYCLRCKQLVCPECIALGSLHFQHDNVTIYKCHEQSLKELENFRKTIENEVFPNIKKKMESLISFDITCEEKYETERKKIEEQGEKLKALVSICTSNVLESLGNVLIRNRNLIREEISQLEQKQKELKNEIKNINVTRMNDNIREILREVVNISSRIQKNSDISVYFPREITTFYPVNTTSADINAVIGCLEYHNIATEVHIRHPIYSYKIAQQISDNSSLAVAKDGTIYVSDHFVSIELKPNEKPKRNRDQFNILDLATSEQSELLFLTSGDNCVWIESDSADVMAIYSLPNSKNVAVALSVCENGKVLVLYVKEVPSSTFKSEFSVKLKIDIISKNGILIKKIKCQFPYKWNTSSINRFRMKENINGHICILCVEQDEVLDLSKDGNGNWKYTMCFANDIETTSVGNIIVSGRYCKTLRVLSCDGKLLTTIHLNFKRPETYNVCSKNCRELVIVSRKELFILELSFPI